MMIRTAPTYRPTTRDLAVLALSMIGVGVGVFAVATHAQDSPPMIEFLGRAQAQVAATRVAGLLGAIDRSAESDGANVTVIAKTTRGER